MISGKYFQRFLGLSSIFFILVITMQNCSNHMMSDLAFSYSLGSSTALVYGDSAEDQKFLQDKLNRYSPPAIKDIYNEWKMISGPVLFDSILKVDSKNQANAYCKTSKNAAGDWVTGSYVNSAGKTVSINPNTASERTDSASAWFAALSWSYFDDSGGRLYNATNSDNFNGFVSNVKADVYTHRATLHSKNGDDDEISIVIAMTRDASGNIHTLSASRSNGGYTSQDLKDKTKFYSWYFIYKVNNTTKRIIPGKDPGIVYKSELKAQNGGSAGWSGRSTVVEVTRNGDEIRAMSTDWNQAMLLPDTEIYVNLANEPDLAIFKGPHHYGYAIRSQPGSSFSDIKFDIPGLQGTIYDLKTGNVWILGQDNKYYLDSSKNAFTELGYPTSVGNPETQKRYEIYAPNSYEAVH
jgi:hypothetical protein